MFLSIATTILLIVAQWKIFTKAGEAGWKSLIPIYNTYILFKIAGNKEFVKLLATFVMSSVLYSIGMGCTMIGSIHTSSDENGALIIILIVGIMAFLIAAFVLFIYYLVIFFRAYADLSENFGKERTFAWGLLLLTPVFLCILAFDNSVYSIAEPAEPFADSVTNDVKTSNDDVDEEFCPKENCSEDEDEDEEYEDEDEEYEDED